MRKEEGGRRRVRRKVGGQAERRELDGEEDEDGD